MGCDPPGAGPAGPREDLRPGYFADRPDRDGVVVARHRLCDYGTGAHREGVAVVRAPWALSLIYYLGGPRWAPGDGGETGLYARGDQPLGRPDVAVPPAANSLLVMTCAPDAYHAFLSDRRLARDTVVVRYHHPLGS